VSKGQTLARLEALLSRVRSRGAEPRIAPATIATPPAEARPEVVSAAPAVAPPPEPPPTGAPVFELDEPTDDLESTQQRSVPSRSAPMRTEADIVVEVEVQATTQETVVAVPVDEVPAPAALESRERLVAAEPAATPVESAELAPAPEPEPSPTLAVQIEEPAEELVPELIPEPGESEEAPASSRRPVAPPPEERLDEMAFGNVEPEPPRHTPPPESGRLPAASDVEFTATSRACATPRARRIRRPPPSPRLRRPSSPSSPRRPSQISLRTTRSPTS